MYYNLKTMYVFKEIFTITFHRLNKIDIHFEFRRYQFSPIESFNYQRYRSINLQNLIVDVLFSSPQMGKIS